MAGLLLVMVGAAFALGDAADVSIQARGLDDAEEFIQAGFQFQSEAELAAAVQYRVEDFEAEVDRFMDEAMQKKGEGDTGALERARTNVMDLLKLEKDEASAKAKKAIADEVLSSIQTQLHEEEALKEPEEPRALALTGKADLAASLEDFEAKVDRFMDEAMEKKIDGDTGALERARTNIMDLLKLEKDEASAKAKKAIADEVMSSIYMQLHDEEALKAELATSLEDFEADVDRFMDEAVEKKGEGDTGALERARTNIMDLLKLEKDEASAKAKKAVADEVISSIQMQMHEEEALKEAFDELTETGQLSGAAAQDAAEDTQDLIEKAKSDPPMWNFLRDEVKRFMKESFTDPSTKDSLKRDALFPFIEKLVSDPAKKDTMLKIMSTFADKMAIKAAVLN